MQEQQLEHILRQVSGEPQERGWRCPDETKLAAYVDRRLDAQTRAGFESHLADCGYCLDQVAFLTRAADWSSDVEVPRPLVNRARGLVAAKQRVPWLIGWRWISVTAATCILLLFSALMVLWLQRSPPQNQTPSNVAQQQQQQSPQVASASTPRRNSDVVAVASPAPPLRSGNPRHTVSVPVIRNGAAANRSPTVIFPRDGALLKRTQLEIRWQPVADAIFYDVLIVTESGDPLVTRQSDGPPLILSGNSQLISGAKYFVSVRA